MDTENNTPLLSAAQNCHTIVSELLIGKASSVEAINHYGYTPLHLAGWESHNIVAEVGLEKGASI